MFGQLDLAHYQETSQTPLGGRNFATLLISYIRNFAKSHAVKQADRTTPNRHRANDSVALAATCAVKLLELRAHTGETQRQLAGRLRMTESMISRLERGDHVPSLRTLCRVADAFGRHLEIAFHEHEHCDGTRHAHPPSHGDPEHQHGHGDKK